MSILVLLVVVTVGVVFCNVVLVTKIWYRRYCRYGKGTYQFFSCWFLVMWINDFHLTV